MSGGDSDFYTPDQAAKLKKLFAHALMHQPDNAFAAARQVETNPGAVSYIATRWPDDETVIFHRREALALSGPLSQVPTKEEFAAAVYRDLPPVKEADARLRYMRFFAELMGYIDTGKNKVEVNLGGSIAGKVLPIPVAVDDVTWEKKAREHYAVLVSRHG